MNYIILLGLLFAFGCDQSEEPATGTSQGITVYDSNIEPKYQIELIREETYGIDEADTEQIAAVSSFLVDDSGRVIVADWNRVRVLVYHPDGHLLNSFGGEGRGPGEFLTMQIAINSGHLYLFDLGNFRINRFSIEPFELMDMIHLDPQSWSQIEELNTARPQHIYVQEDHTYLIRFDDPVINPGDEYSQRFYRFDEELKLVSGLLFQRPGSRSHVVSIGGRSAAIGFPFLNQSLLAISDEGHFISASSEEFLIEVYGPDGNPLRAFTHSYDKSLITRSDLDTLRARHDDHPVLTRGFQTVEIPDYWPALNNILTDDENRIWVSTVTDSRDHFEWWVLDEFGELLARFEWPGEKLTDSPGHGRNRMLIRNGSLYMHEIDDESDRQQIVRYRIEMEKTE